jgi:two-component system OmpR family sensor kinase
MNLTSYEKKSLIRFLSLYLFSVSVLLLVIGYIFYKLNTTILINKIKFEMLYNSRIIEDEIIKIISKDSKGTTVRKEIISRFIPLNYTLEILDKNLNPLFGEIKEPIKLEKSFYKYDDQCFSIIKKPLKDGSISYIILKSDALKRHLTNLKLNIFYTLFGVFIFMAIIGFFLSHLFLKPIREKIEEIDKFIEDTAHELNTPISAIMMTVETLKCDDKKRLKRLKASATRLTNMYQTLIYTLRENNFERDVKSFSLKRLIKNRVDYLKILAETKMITLESRLEDIKIKANSEDIKIMIDNILTNAIKYTDPNGKINITLKDGIVKICDNGIGIKDKYLKDIFKRYRRFNQERGGLGIGLSIVLKIANKYNIPLEVKSKEKIGTCFILDFNTLKAEE